MGSPSESLWTDVEALHRLARAEREIAQGPSPLRSTDAHTPVSFPPFPHRREFGVHAVEAPMTLAAGDFCDTFLLGPDTLAVVVADVSGKGVAAAMVRGVARSVIRNVSPVCRSPGELLERLDRILTEAELGSMFLTAFVGWYDTREGTLHYANAGHPVPYRVSRSGRAAPFGRVTGSILGILGRQTYSVGQERLEVGERLVLYTDGVTEATNANDESFGPRSFAALLEENAGAAPADLCRTVIECVRRFEGQRKQDDVSLLVLDRLH